MEKIEKAYCISCGEEVEVEAVDLGIDGEELYRCSQCGAYLGTRKSLEKLSSIEEAEIQAPPEQITSQVQAKADFHSETSTVSDGAVPEMPVESQSAKELKSIAEDEILTPTPMPQPELPKIETIILAEDSELVTRILKEMIIKKNLSRRVISCKNGFDFIIHYIQNRLKQTPIGLVILDVIMPVLNGISTAVAMRAWERALGLKPVPILYFTSKRCDQVFKRVLQHTRPAMYINKGASQSAFHLEQRIEKVVNQLLKESF